MKRKRLWKQKILSLAVLCFFIGTFLPVSYAADSWQENQEISSAELKIGLIGDAHVTTDASWFQTSLEAQMTIAGGTLDGLALTGDVIYQNNSNELLLDRYDSVMSILQEKGFGSGEGKTPFVYAMGNHEFPQANTDATVSANSIALFEEKTRQPANYHTTINGYHFIAASPMNYNNAFSEETQTWIMEQIRQAVADDPTKPVFFIAHPPVDGTIFKNSYNGFTDEFVTFLKSTPQVINLSAHMHIAAQLPQTIYQDGFTAFQTPLTGGGYLDEWGCASTENISSVHQGAMLSVNEGVVKIYKLDLVTKEYIGEPWVIDIPQIVANKTDEDPNNDNDAYLYSADKRQNSQTPSFPADANVTATVFNTNSVSISFPNSATNVETPNQQDGFIRGYKIEICTSDGNVLTSSIHQNDFYLETQSETMKKTLNGMPYDSSLVVNVYPMSPLGIFGEPISASLQTEKETVPEYAQRYEFEDYCTNTSLVKSTVFASGGKIVSSNQGGMIEDHTIAGRDNDPSFSFEIQIPSDGNYRIEYALGYHQHNTDYVSPVAIRIDDTLIGENDNSFDSDLSLFGAFPWSYIPLKHYSKTVALKQGTHTVSVDVTLPVVTTQPYLFCADYLQITPLTVSIPVSEDTTIEFEDHDSIFSDTPNIKMSENASGGEYIHFDTNTRTDPINFYLPINVAESGMYNFEYVASDVGSKTEFYLDDAAQSFYSTSGATFTYIDEEKVDGIWPYFNETWHQARKYTFSMYLTAGSHTLNGKLLTRSADGTTDVCICMDYLKMKLVDMTKTVYANEKTRIEFEDFASTFSINQSDGTVYTAEPALSTGCSNGQYMWIDSTDDVALNQFETFVIPINVEQAGNYDMEFVDCRGVSAMKIFLDSTDGTCLSNNLATTEDATKDENDKYAYFTSSWAVAVKHNGTVYLPEGEHQLVFQLEMRSGVKDFAMYLDYISFQPAEGFTIEDNVATAVVSFDAPVSGKVILSLYNDLELISTNYIDVTDANYVTVTAPAPSAATRAKVFVWKDFVNCVPKEKPIEFKIS